MRHLNNSLLNNEYMLSIANFHWYIFVPGIVLYLLALTAFVFDELIWFLLGTYIMGLAFIFFLIPIIKNITTELTITTIRVIFKTGLIKRRTVELNLSKIESLCVSQSALGRLLGFGTLMFNLTGGKQIKISGICKPLEFKDEVRHIINVG